MSWKTWETTRPWPT